MRDLLTLIALGAGAGLAAGPAAANFDVTTEPAPVIDFASDVDEEQALEVVLDGLVADLLFSAPIPGFSSDAGFEDELFVDFGLTFDFATNEASSEFFSIEDGDGILVESFSVVETAYSIGDGANPVFEGHFLFDELSGAAASAFGGQALVTIDSLELIDDDVSGSDFFAAFTVAGLVESVSTGIAPIPLPAGLPLLAAGLGAVALLRTRRAA